MSARDDLGEVHHGDERRTAGSHLSRIERTVRDRAIDGTANFGIGKLSLRSEILAFRRRQTPLRGLDLVRFANRLESFQVLLRQLVLVSSLGVGHISIIEVLARDRSLLVERLAAVVELLLGVEGFFRRLQIKFCFVGLLRRLVLIAV